MFQDKDIVNDYLNGLGASLKGYAGYITESNNPQLRQKFIELRDRDEARQLKVYQYALQNGYYKPAKAASPQEIQQVQNELSQGS
ncbi:spore coat protein [Oceanobacillus sp. J11TS1]|uniref:spore coat protein n=1 Tax=Oceanobacillus sp. J11TS1 TaxID=2807191 RepID=UPI001B0BA671|nr:spore coat protein [Oceanobacillus sp. J11TS1]GIO22906.1 coat protein F [Oceanobacillus sp. J11TS1]